MLRRINRVLESPVGTGEIVNNGERVAKVRYDLRIEVEKILATSFIGNKASLARKFISGTFSIVEGDIHTTESGGSGSFALVLDDGRTFPFKITARTVASDGPYEILGTIDKS